MQPRGEGCGARCPSQIGLVELASGEHDGSAHEGTLGMTAHEENLQAGVRLVAKDKQGCCVLWHGNRAILLKIAHIS